MNLVYINKLELTNMIEISLSNLLAASNVLKTSASFDAVLRYAALKRLVSSFS